jgi:hypothetical protein
MLAECAILLYFMSDLYIKCIIQLSKKVTILRESLSWTDVYICNYAP